MIVTAGLLLYGCASVKDVQILDKEADRLYSQSDTNRKNIESLKREFSALREEIQRDFSAFQKENQNLRADLLLRIETLQSEVRVLTSGVEEYKDVARKPSKELDRMREDVTYRTKILEEKSKSFEEQKRTQDDRLKGIEERTMAIDDRLKSLESKIDQLAKQSDLDKSDLARGKESTEIKTSSTGAASLYKDAYEAFQKGDLDGARLKFEVFLKQYPNTELSDNAQFWIGETFYQKRDYEKAILEYEKVIVKYPEGEKVSSALYKQAIAFLELGDKTNARNLLKRVMERYPQSEQAEMAKKRLETIK
jgi:tol-pal system protein YbgF